jgi:PIN domain nuclease of toxin-antitoxin system
VKKILLDTHAFIWWIEDSPRLSTNAKKLLENLENECFLSLASCWELAIKSSIGKIKLTLPIRDFIPQHLAANDFKQLSISFRHIARVESLEFHHRDPFDRLIAAQALEEKMILFSVDKVFDYYGVERIW